jgi:thiol-disulfide isomerase/thioredoxin
MQAIGSLMNVSIPSWALVLIFAAVKFFPGLLGIPVGVGKGSPAAPLDESVVMLQGLRPQPGAPGKVVVIERWATWCPPCVASVPHLNGLHAKYGGRNDFELVGVTDETDQEKIRDFMLLHGVRYPIGLDTKGVVARGYPSIGIPNATIVGVNGVVYWRGHPMSMDEPLEQALNGAVAAPHGGVAGAAAPTMTEDTKRAE